RHTRLVSDWSSDVCSSDLWRRIAAHHLHPGLAQAPRDMPAAGRDVDRRLRARRPLDDQVEIGALAVRLAFAVQLRPLAPGVAHRSEERRVGKESRARGDAY